MRLNPCPHCPCGTDKQCPLTVCVVDCAGPPIAGATVKLKDLAGSVIETETTNSDGCVGFTLPQAGRYELVVSAPDHITYDRVVQLSCHQSLTVALSRGGSVQFGFQGCCGKDFCNDVYPTELTIEGVTYTLNDNNCLLWGVTDPGTYCWTAAVENYQELSGCVTIPRCPPAPIQAGGLFLPIGYLYGVSAGRCCVVDDRAAAGPGHDMATHTTRPPSVTLVDSVYGGCRLDNINIYGTGCIYWGMTTAHWAGRAECPAKSFQIGYAWEGNCDWVGRPNPGKLFVYCSACIYRHCLTCTDFAQGQPCPCDAADGTICQPIGPGAGCPDFFHFTDFVPLIAPNPGSGTPLSDGAGFMYDTGIINSAEPLDVEWNVPAPTVQDRGITRTIYPDGATIQVLG